MTDTDLDVCERCSDSGWAYVEDESAVVRCDCGKLTRTPVHDDVVPARARRSDPWTSHVAAQRIEPSAGTRAAQVLARLRDQQGGWVDGSELATQSCGGSEGLRRLRELRTHGGFEIERRPHPHRATEFQYRLSVTRD